MKTRDVDTRAAALAQVTRLRKQGRKAKLNGSRKDGGHQIAYDY